MERNRLDTFTKWLARGRFSRRRAFLGGVAALATASRIPVLAQTGTPIGSPTAGGGATEFLAVQSFGAGVLEPKSGATGTYTLMLSQGSGRTLYFSDRPERIVGTMPTQTFLDQLGFSPSNPPNAALVAATGNRGRDDETILILELLNPRYDAATQTTVYDVHVLSDYERMRIRFDREPQRAVKSVQTYGASDLFIDAADYTCGQLNVWCYTEPSDGTCNYIGELGPMKFCYSSHGVAGCAPCTGDSASWIAECNQTFAACGGACNALYQQPWSSGFPGC